MKKITKLLTTITCGVLLNNQAFCLTPAQPIGFLDALYIAGGWMLTNIRADIAFMHKETAKLLEEKFGVSFDDAKKPTAFGTVYKMADQYALHFYEWFTTKSFSGLDFSAKNKDNMDAIKKMIAREVGYNLQKSAEEKNYDSEALLVQKIEKDANNIPSTVFGDTIAGASQYGGVDEKAPIIDEVPTLGDLIGTDSYAIPADKEKARLFISYVLQSMPAPKSIFIPKAENNATEPLYVSLPYPNIEEHKPFTYVQIETKPDLDKDKKPSSEYARMLNYLNRDSLFYQPYKMKVRTANVLRTLYTEAMLRSYQDRVQDKEGKSLIEREKEIVASGLNKEYYDALKLQTVADVNLEILQAINKLSYFIYRLHQDNERIALILATSGMRLSTQDALDEKNYLRPLGIVMEKKCWDLSAKSSADVKDACANPTKEAQKRMSQM